jgi:hypothetical protein
VQSADVTTAGVAGITATAGGSLTMGDGITTSTSGGAGTIDYAAVGAITLGRLATGGAVRVTSNGGSILNGNSGPPNITAGGAASLQAGGVIGVDTTPIAVAVTGPVSVNPSSVQSGISANVTGTASGGTLTFPASVSGRVLFNGVLLNPAPAAPSTPAATSTPAAPSIPAALSTPVDARIVSHFIESLRATPLPPLAAPATSVAADALSADFNSEIEGAGIALPNGLSDLPAAAVGAPERKPRP